LLVGSRRKKKWPEATEMLVTDQINNQKIDYEKPISHLYFGLPRWRPSPWNTHEKSFIGEFKQR